MTAPDSDIESGGIAGRPEGFGQDTVLRTKLFRPPPHPGMIPRPGLVARLDANPTARLALVSAPPGFGKTTLVAEWLAAGGAPLSAWLLLDDGDNEPGRFWRHVVAALQTADPRLGARLADTLGRHTLPPPETWLTVLLNDLAALSRPIVLALDEYHHIRAPAIHHGVDYLLRHAPPGMRLALISRADPPLSLARLRVADELVELRAADLRFSRPEMERYLNGEMGLGLSLDDVALLEQRTEGWPAGVHLAAHSLRGYDAGGRHDFVQTFSGSHHYVLNYLLEEVLQQQAPDVRDFLLRTSILRRLSAPLCAAVMGQPVEAVEPLLPWLARENLFTQSLDEDQRWFRYHPLFAESLETRLRQSDPARWRELHRRAGAWCAGNGHPGRAIAHALAAEEFETAADLIERVAERTWTHGEVDTLLRWLEALPPAVLAGRIDLRLLHIWLLVLHNRWDEAARLRDEVEAAVERLPEPQHTVYRGRWATIAGAMAAQRCEPEAAIRMAQQAQALLPAGEGVWRAAGLLDLGLAHMMTGNAGPAAAAFRAAAELSVAHENAYLAFAALGHLGHVCAALGRLHEAEATWQRLRELEGMPGGAALALRAHGDVGLGLIAYERDDLPAAERLLGAGLEAIWPGGHPRLTLLGRVALAQTHAARGDWPAARRQLEEGAEMARQLRLPGMERTALAHGARLARREGQLDVVAGWMEAAGLSPQAPADFRRETEQIVLVEALLADGRFGEAEGLAGRLRAAAERAGRAGSLIRLLLLHALALAGQRRLPEAETAVARALRLAEPQGYARIFLDLGAPLMELLRRPGVRQVTPAYAGQLLRAFDVEITPSPVVGETPALNALDELTQREREILAYVARGASNQDIADELVLSVGTVKGHINHIFGKLGVHSRTAAVARARERELIES